MLVVVDHSLHGLVVAALRALCPSLPDDPKLFCVRSMVGLPSDAVLKRGPEAFYDSPTATISIYPSLESRLGDPESPDFVWLVLRNKINAQARTFKIA